DNRSIDDLLAEFDAATQQPAPEATADSTGGDNVAPNVSGDEVDKLLAELSVSSADQQKITDLEGQISGFRAAEDERKSRADFDAYSSKLQAECGPHVPDDFAVTELKAALVDKPELEMAWRYRHVTNDQLRAAEREFQQLEALHYRATQQPDGDPRKPQ